jgi:hypothetical protein
VNCTALERMISGDLAVRRELDKFELMQIWITDPQLGDKAFDQADRMAKEFQYQSIPLHVIVDPSGRELARYVFQGPLSTPKEYLEFLERGLAKFKR